MQSAESGFIEVSASFSSPEPLRFASVRPLAQRRIYSLNAEPLAEIERWLEPFRRFWDHKLEALATEVARGKRKKRRPR